MWIQAIETSMDDVRGAIMLIQLFGIAVLFIDYVTRFDEIKRQFWQGLAVGTCMIGWLFQIFVYFLTVPISSKSIPLVLIIALIQF